MAKCRPMLLQFRVPKRSQKLDFQSVLWYKRWNHVLQVVSRFYLFRSDPNIKNMITNGRSSVFFNKYVSKNKNRIFLKPFGAKRRFFWNFFEYFWNISFWREILNIFETFFWNFFSAAERSNIFETKWFQNNCKHYFYKEKLH